MRLAILGLLAMVLAVGCASDWARVRAEDSPVAYRRFLADSPRSSHAIEARERLAYLLLDQRPTRSGYEQFRSDFPDSEWLSELDARFEQRDFEAARAIGTVSAYERFLAEHAAGALAARVEGNLVYLRSNGFGSDPAALAGFAAAHPVSDFADEALRTVAGLQAHRSTPLRRVGLEISIVPELPDARRLAVVFAERAEQGFRGSGIELVPAGDGRVPEVDAWLRIEHEEVAVGTELQGGRVTGAGTLARTRVTLTSASNGAPIWSEEFTFRAASLEKRAGSSVLFSPRAPAFWSQFFVPVATWPTQTALRPAFDLRPGVAAVSAELGRAVALFGDGSFREVDLADPNQPGVLWEYARPPDLSAFSGVRRLDGRVVLFGEDGIEVVVPSADGPMVVRRLDRAQTGAVTGVEVVGDHWIVAGSRGLLRVPIDEGAPEELSGNALRGLARTERDLWAIDDEHLYRVPVEGAHPGPVAPVMRLERGMRPIGLRAGADTALVWDDRSILVLDLSVPARPRLRMRLRARDVGQITDAAVVDGHAFLVGARGLQVLDLERGRVIDSVDVEGRLALDASGRHLVVVGPDRLQVVDVTAWTLPRHPASPEK